MKNIALHILDLVENSSRAEAGKVVVCITEKPEKDQYILVIEDDGKGMSEEVKKKATDPFYTSRTTRKIGMGLPLIQQNAERTGGSFSLQSIPGSGTRLEAIFVFSHPDRLPLGEIDEVLVLLAACYPQLRLVYEHRAPGGTYRFDTSEVEEIAGKICNCNQEIRKFLREMILENLRGIGAEIGE
jgi:hypothetical protein